MVIFKIDGSRKDNYLVFQSELKDKDMIADRLKEMLNENEASNGDYDDCIEEFRTWCSDNYGVYPVWVDKDSVVEIIL